LEIPIELKRISLSESELILPIAAAYEALNELERLGIPILGWEGMIRLDNGHIGHGNAPQGTVGMELLEQGEAFRVCRETLAQSAASWRLDNPGSSAELVVCLTTGAD
jgi:hypothetical protein